MPCKSALVRILSRICCSGEATSLTRSISKPCLAGVIREQISWTRLASSSRALSGWNPSSQRNVAVEPLALGKTIRVTLDAPVGGVRCLLVLKPQLRLMAARHRVAKMAQVFSQVFLHQCCSLERHWVQVRIKLRQQSDTVSSHHPGTLNALLVIGVALLRPQAGHAHIDTGFVGQSSGIGGSNLAKFAHGGIKEHHINTV